MRHKSANNQKALLAALSLILVISLLAGCGSGASDAGSAGSAEEAEAETPVPEFVLLGYYDVTDPDHPTSYLPQYNEAGRFTALRFQDPINDVTYTAAYDDAALFCDESGLLSEARQDTPFGKWFYTVSHDENGQIRSATRTQEMTEAAEPEGTETVSNDPVTWEYAIRDDADGGKTVTVTIVSDEKAPSVSQTYAPDGVILQAYNEDLTDPALSNYYQHLWDAFHFYDVEQDRIPQFCWECADEIRSPGHFIHEESSGTEVTEVSAGYVITRALKEYGAERTIRLVYGHIGDDPEALLAEAAEKKNQELNAGLPDWSVAYREFVLNGGFLSSGQEYGGMSFGGTEPSYEYVQFGLYDLDRNGVPELLAEKGATSRAAMSQYVYTFENGAVRFLGHVGAYETGYEFAPDSDYHGLFNIWMQMGCGDCSYVTVENGELQVTTVYSYQENVDRSDPNNPVWDGFLFTQVTEDDALYQLAMEVFEPYHNNSGDQILENGLPMYTIEEINGMGWNAFAGAF